jgi:hypothetical protein
MKGGGGGPGTVVVNGGDLHVHGAMDSATLPQVQAIVAEANRRQMDEFQRNAGSVQA